MERRRPNVVLFLSICAGRFGLEATRAAAPSPSSRLDQRDRAALGFCPEATLAELGKRF